MSKTFKALQRASEERARNLKSDPKPASAKPEVIIEPEVDTNALKIEADRVTAEIAIAVEELEQTQTEREKALREIENANALRLEVSRETKIATQAERTAREAELSAAEREQAAEKASLEASRQREAEDSARLAAKREREVLESVKAAVAEERAAQELTRIAVEKERSALKALKRELEATKTSMLDNEPAEAITHGQVEEHFSEIVENDNSIPSSELPVLDDRLPDPALQKLLQTELSRSTDPGPLKVGPLGRVSGELNLERASALLSRYALLHCVKEDRDLTLWFWGNSKEARDYATKRGLPLDKDALS